MALSTVRYSSFRASTATRTHRQNSTTLFSVGRSTKFLNRPRRASPHTSGSPLLCGVVPRTSTTTTCGYTRAHTTITMENDNIHKMISSGNDTPTAQGYLARYAPTPQYAGLEPHNPGMFPWGPRRVAAAIPYTHPVARA